MSWSPALHSPGGCVLSSSGVQHSAKQTAAEVPALGKLRVRPLGQGSRLVTVEGLSVDGTLSQD